MLRRTKSLLNTAIEVDTDGDIKREQIARELEKSLYRLSHQLPLDDQINELVVEDQWSYLRRLEEIRVIKSFDRLSSLYPELWQEAIRRSNSGEAELENFDSDNSLKLTDKVLKQNRVPTNLRNWRERVKDECAENMQLLKQLYARKEKLEREREEVNRMVGTIAQIFDESHTGHETTNIVHNTPSNSKTSSDNPFP